MPYKYVHNPDEHINANIPYTCMVSSFTIVGISGISQSCNLSIHRHISASIELRRNPFITARLNKHKQDLWYVVYVHIYETMAMYGEPLHICTIDAVDITVITTYSSLLRGVHSPHTAREKLIKMVKSMGYIAYIISINAHLYIRNGRNENNIADWRVVRLIIACAVRFI